MRHGKRPRAQTIEELAEDWGIDFQTYKIKAGLIDTIKAHCRKHGISQRKLAARVPGLTQDRVSKIFSGQTGHMTIDKLVAISTAIGIKVEVTTRDADEAA